MRTKLYLSLLLVFVFSFAVFGQNASVTKRTVTYERLFPLNEDKTRFVVEYPRVRMKSRAVSQKIEKNLSFGKVMNLDIAREKDGRDQWLEFAGFYVDYNARGILSVTLSANGTGQFFSTFNKSIAIDLKTGNQLTADRVFKNLPGLAALVKTRQRQQIEQAKIDIPKLEGYSDFDAGKWFSLANITVENLKEFSIGKDGVTFKYDYGFPRIMLPAQPDGIYLVKWSDLKPFIRRGRALGKFIY